MGNIVLKIFLLLAGGVLLVYVWSFVCSILSDKAKAKKMLKILLQLVGGVVLFYGWAFMFLILAFSTPAAKLLFPAAAVFFIGGFLLFHYVLWKHRIIWKIAVGLMALSLLFGGSVLFHRWWTVDRFPELKGQVKWWNYAPFKGEKTVQVTPEEKYRLSGRIPTINGAYALYPLYAAVVQSLCPPGDYSWTVRTDGSDTTFRLLLGNWVKELPPDLIFSAPPSKQQLEDAAKLKLTYEITPFAKEAFVFFVPSTNPVSNLSQEQIRGIYSGRIRNWKEVGGPDIAIKPFQRNEGSGSQTMLQKIMGGTPIMPPIKADRLGGMGDIINDVANYRNSKDAIGFTFRYFSTEMFRNGSIKLLSIDGIEPSLENIRNGSYPFLTDCCVITCRHRSENTRKIVDFLFSPAGQELIRKVGYTPIGRKEKPNE